MSTKNHLIGRTGIVRDKKHRPSALVEARFIDDGKRLRLVTGEHAGEVRFLGEVEFLEYVEHTEAAACLVGAWPDND